MQNDAFTTLARRLTGGKEVSVFHSKFYAFPIGIRRPDELGFPQTSNIREDALKTD